MSYKYSKGSQVIGDLKAADDTQRDTLIDFGEDRIDLQTSGSTRLKISGSSGKITFNEAYSFPTSDGSANQYLKTDGSGNLTFSAVSADGGSSIVDADGDTKIQAEEGSDEDKIRFDTAGSERMIIDNNGKVGIGTSNPDANLDIAGNVKIDSSIGRIGVGMHLGGGTDGGATPAYVNGGNDPNYRIHVIGDATNGAAFATETYANASGGSKFRFVKGRGTPGSPSAVNANDEVGRIEFYAHTGSDTMKLSAMIACFADADGDGKLSFRSTHNGADNEAFYLHDNRVYFTDQVRIGNVIAPTTNGGTNIGGAGARFEQIHGNNFLAYQSVKIDDTFIYGQDGYGVTFGIDYVAHTDTPGNDAQSSHMSALTYASSNPATRNVAFNMIKTGSHTAGLGTYGTGNSNEKVVLFGQYNTTAFEFRNNVGVEPLLIQSGSLLMTLSAAGDLGIGTSAPMAKLDVAGKMAISSESNTPAQPADGKGYLYSKSDGKLYWRSHDISETDLTSGGGGGGGSSNRSVYMGYVSLQTTARVVSYDLGQNLGPTANNNFKGMIIVPFDGLLDSIIVSPKGQDVTDANFGNVTVTVYKNQSNFGSGTSVAVTGDNFVRKTPDGSNNPKIYSGIFDFNMAVAAGDLIQIKANRTNGASSDTLVTVVFTEG